LAKRRKNPPPAADRDEESAQRDPVLRIVGGTFRGRKLLYTGDLRTRPMKDRVREALFNLLGPAVKGSHALDLFSGTGALGFEALSRGAARATLIEQHFPTANLIRQNAELLEAGDRTQVEPANAFIWVQRFIAATHDPAEPWLVFCSPPYAFYVDRQEEMLTMIRGLVQHAPLGSLFAVESDDQFDPALLPDPEEWDIRRYPPAVLAVRHMKTGREDS